MVSKIILYAEDEENDVLLLQLGFKRAGVMLPLHVVRDGQQAVDYLSGNGDYGDRERYPLPDLLLLDLNLPRLSGLQVLQWLREQPQLAALPVVIYTSSDHPSDKDSARGLGASEYILKPSRLDQIAEVAKRLEQQLLASASGQGAEILILPTRWAANDRPAEPSPAAPD